MFAPIEVLSEAGDKYIKSINAIYVSDHEPYNFRDIDQGTIIFMKDGRQIFTPLPFDVVSRRLDLALKRYSVIAMILLADNIIKGVEDEIEEEIDEESEKSDT